MIPRLAIIILSLSLVMLSVLFGIEGDLYYATGVDVNRIHLTRDLVSSGSDDNQCVVVGAVIFSALFFFLLGRVHLKLVLFDVIGLCVALVVQLVWLAAIDAGDISLSMAQENGWILVCWFSAYFLLYAMAALAIRSIQSLDAMVSH